MRICYLADARSPHVTPWVEQFTRDGHAVHVLSSHIARASFEHRNVPSLASWGRRADVALGGVAKSVLRSELGGANLTGIQVVRRPVKRAVAAAESAAARVDRRIAPTLVANAVRRFDPDVVHVMRLVEEGLWVGPVCVDFPVILSVWGNELTMTSADPRIRVLIERILPQLAGFIADSKQDVDVARAFGLPTDTPTLVVPSGGGLDVGALPPTTRSRWAPRADRSRVVINPRGVRHYVCQQAFVEAIGLVHAEHPDVVALGVGMDSDVQLRHRIAELGLNDVIIVTPELSQRELYGLFSNAAVSVSPSRFDGTPNSLLESMAAGCLPIAGDIPSIREWITDGHNGLLCTPDDPGSIAAAIRRGLSDNALHERAASFNAQQLLERADRARVMDAVSRFYETAVGRWPSRSCSAPTANRRRV
jgi:glycosyltransferase involved in cell wall biosynthesis